MASVKADLTSYMERKCGFHIERAPSDRDGQIELWCFVRRRPDGRPLLPVKHVIWIPSESGNKGPDNLSVNTALITLCHHSTESSPTFYETLRALITDDIQNDNTRQSHLRQKHAIKETK